MRDQKGKKKNFQIRPVPFLLGPEKSKLSPFGVAEESDLMHDVHIPGPPITTCSLIFFVARGTYLCLFRAVQRMRGQLGVCAWGNKFSPKSLRDLVMLMPSCSEEAKESYEAVGDNSPHDNSRR